MPRIAAVLLIVVAVLTLNGTLTNTALAKDVMATPAPRLDEPLPKSAKLLSLLMVLESLRQAPVDLQNPKV